MNTIHMKINIIQKTLLYNTIKTDTIQTKLYNANKKL